jgi:hypothetical protein
MRIKEIRERMQVLKGFKYNKNERDIVYLLSFIDSIVPLIWNVLDSQFGLSVSGLDLEKMLHREYDRNSHANKGN